MGKTVTDPTFAALTAIRHAADKAKLVRYALERHGYGDSDGGFGVTYPGDLDEYDRKVNGLHVPEGFVLCYGFWGPPEGTKSWSLSVCIGTYWRRCWSAWGCGARRPASGRPKAGSVADKPPA